MQKTDKQRQIFRHAVTGPTGPRWLFAIGATRTGKTAAVAAAHAAFTQLGAMPTRDHAIIGPNLSQIRRNIVEAEIGTLSVLRRAGHRGASLSTVGGWHVQVPRGRGRTCKIWLIGGSDEKAVNRITGSTFGSVVCDELPLLPESVWNQAMARMLSVPGARGWATGQPGPDPLLREPVHPATAGGRGREAPEVQEGRHGDPGGRGCTAGAGVHGPFPHPA